MPAWTLSVTTTSLTACRPARGSPLSASCRRRSPWQFDAALGKLWHTLTVHPAMLFALKRLGIGLGLIALASTILLVSDRRPEVTLGSSVDVVGQTAIANTGPQPGPLTRLWRVSLVELNQTLDVEESEKGVLDGLREAGLVEGRDFAKTVRNAHGDMATVSAMVDAAVSERVDLMITFSTPTLQAALRRANRLPVVFAYVADPIAAGAGASDTDHVANVTGVYLIGAYAPMMPLIRQIKPDARVLGTIYVPAEVNMVVQLAVMDQAVRDAGMELKSIAANSAAEVQEAALALVSCPAT
jgi:putative tryptophan/tyrosine transport system substrate-binding protein